MEKQDPSQRLVLLEAAQACTTQAGVYLMKESRGGVLYVGKAKHLKQRLVSYFQPLVHDNARIALLVQCIDQFEVILTQTEVEALILEATLIKRYRPRFNIRLKDDKAYPYLKIDFKAQFPRIEWTRRVIKDEARYFGPFPSVWAARQVLQLVNQTFQLRDCADNSFLHRSRPCLLYQMHHCLAPCMGWVEPGSYSHLMEEAVAVLEGKSQKLLVSVQTQMKEAAEKEDYELAAFFRDQWKCLDLITQTQGVQQAGSDRSCDVLGIAQEQGRGHGVLLKIRKGSLVAVQHFTLQCCESGWTSDEIFAQFLLQYYLSDFEGDRLVMAKDLQLREILIPSPLLDQALFEALFSIPIRSIQEESQSIDSQFIRVARLNAEYALKQNVPQFLGHGIVVLEEIQQQWKLPRLPRRMECFDISNFQGGDSVASRVVFMDGAPEKTLYRRYQIKTVKGANDFAMMQEVLRRRFLNLDEELPDLLVVDGGKGQLSQALLVLEELKIATVPVVGLAKARLQSQMQGVELERSDERIIFPDERAPFVLLPQSAMHALLTHLRDEAHRFAIQYHRKKMRSRLLDC